MAEISAQSPPLPPLTAMLKRVLTVSIAIGRWPARLGRVLLTKLGNLIFSSAEECSAPRKEETAAASSEEPSTFTNLPPVEPIDIEVERSQVPVRPSEAYMPLVAELPAEVQEKESTPPASGRCSNLAEQLNDENLRELVKDRLNDLQEEETRTQAWALALVDLLDELKLMRPSYSECDAKVVSRLAQEFERLLQGEGFTRIDLDEWNPALQRAIRVERTLPEGAPAAIISKGASGLIIGGRLIRKQEVILNLSPDT